MAAAMWSPMDSKSRSAAGNGSEEMTGGEIAVVWRLESSVTVSSVFRSAREVAKNASRTHSQTAAIVSAQPPNTLSLVGRLCGFIREMIGNDCARGAKPRQLRAGLPLNANRLARCPGNLMWRFCFVAGPLAKAATADAAPVDDGATGN